MARRKRPLTPSWPGTPFGLWSDLARHSSDMWLASGEVMAQRGARMARMTAQPNSADRRELRRMVDEKVSASNESARASASKAAEIYRRSIMQWTEHATRHTQAMFGFGKAPRLNISAIGDEAARAAAHILKAGMEPYRQRVHGNVKRLRKKF